MPSGENLNATHAPGREGELDIMRVEVSGLLARWVFPGQGTHGSYAMYRVDGCTRTRLVYFSKYYYGRRKKESQDNKRTTNRCTTTCSERCAHAHRTARFVAARNPAACVYVDACRQMRVAHIAVVSKAYINKCAMVTKTKQRRRRENK